MADNARKESRAGATQFPPSPAELLNLPDDCPASKAYKLTHGTGKDQDASSEPDASGDSD